jgi:hypothetical protein
MFEIHPIGNPMKPLIEKRVALGNKIKTKHAEEEERRRIREANDEAWESCDDDSDSDDDDEDDFYRMPRFERLHYLKTENEMLLSRIQKLERDERDQSKINLYLLFALSVTALGLAALACKTLF